MSIEYKEYWGDNSSTGSRYSRPFPDAEVYKYKAAVSALSNEDLLDEYTTLAAGDDWDGALTRGGQIVYDLLREELRSRLLVIGFIEERDE